MKFYMPVRVFEEKNCVISHSADLAALGKKALIVTGKKSAFANGSFDDVKTALDKEGVSYTVFSDVEENPSTETVINAGRKYAAQNIDFVIGIGGGSPMDAAKAIALVMRHPLADLDYLYDSTKDPSALPVVCVPTTCGTGSEVTGVSVLTRHDRKTKISMVHKVYPDIALVDGKYLATASPALIRNSSVDALAHLYESVLSAKADAYTKMTASEGLRTWAKIKDCLTGDKKPGEEECADLMRASVMAGMSIAQSGTSLPHALSYTLTYDLGLAHGLAVGIFLPGFLEAAPEEKRNYFLELSGFSGTDELGDFIGKVLVKPDIPTEELEKTFEAVRNNKAKMNSASFPVDEKMLEKMVYDLP
ncbi:MAG: iron-containing alcohol dehydrogenase [Lachnospiraceae bacterium]|nr:iron-containing alcohol dehydrogenase [Lachnospiraceae bacterium]